MMLERLFLELFNRTRRIESLRTLCRALLTVETAPESCIDDRLQMLGRTLRARVGDEFFCLDKGERIEEVICIQRVFVALGDTGAAENAACVFLVLVEISGRLTAAGLGGKLVLRLQGGLHLLDARVLRIPVDYEIADDGKVAERLDRQFLGLVSCEEILNEHLTGEFGVAVYADGTRTADTRAAGARKGECRIELLLDIGQRIEDGQSRGDGDIVGVHPLFPLDEAMDFELHVHVNTSFPLAGTS